MKQSLPQPPHRAVHRSDATRPVIPAKVGIHVPDRRLSDGAQGAPYKEGPPRCAEESFFFDAGQSITIQ